MSWVERAQVGDKVVCIEGGFWYGWNGEDSASGPRNGDICTISEIAEHTELVWFTFFEYSVDHEFDARAFKPVKNTDTEVEALKRICLNTPETVS